MDLAATHMMQVTNRAEAERAIIERERLRIIAERAKGLEPEAPSTAPVRVRWFPLHFGRPRLGGTHG